MPSIHGSWIIHPQQQYFFLWGEIWRTLISKESTEIESRESTEKNILPHPFYQNLEELTSNLESYQLPLSKIFHNNNSLEDYLQKKWQLQTITLPSKTTEKGDLLPFLSEEILNDSEDFQSISLHSWQVKGLSLTPAETVSLLQALPLGNETYLGGDLRFWLQVYRWSLDLLARGKFFPNITQLDENKAMALWQPLVDSNQARIRFAKFSQLMPPACYSYQTMTNQEGESISPQQLLLSFLSSILDNQLRNWVDEIYLPNVPSIVQIWIANLAKKTFKFKAKTKEINRLETALQNWTLPIQDYLVNPHNGKLEQNLFRICFQLQPPTKKDIETGNNNWQLQYKLQALDEPEFLVDAQTIWQNPVDELVILQRTIKQPQETLLKGLGLASRLFPTINDSLQTSQPLSSSLNPIEVYQFIRSTAWQLQDNGLGVILPPGLASGAGEKRLGIKIEAEIIPKKGERLSLKSLLKYNLKLAAGDKTISKQDFENLLEQKSPLVEIDGEWIALQPADVRAAAEVLKQSKTDMTLSVEDALRLSTGDTKVIAKLPVVKFETSGVLQELIDNINNNQSIQTIETPQEFQGKLRPYQLRGVSWLGFLERWGLGACLADDMGLGKTLQFIGFMLKLKEEGMLVKPILVVCPTSVINNWQKEIQKFAPVLSTLIHHGDKRSKDKTFAKEIKKINVVITSYSLVYRDLKTLQNIEWLGVVLDEAQNIKNPQAKQSQSVRKLNTGFRVALTGTPVENRLSELWSILDFLNPGFLGERQFFQRRFAIPIEKYGDGESLQTLRSLVQPFILRRLKTDKDIITDLPEKQEMNVFCGLSKKQAQLYQQLVDQSLTEIESESGIKRRGLILTLLLKLKQLCNHPSLFLKEKKLQSSQLSGKLMRLEEMLEELIDRGDRALIFTQFSEWGKLLKPYLEKKLATETLFLYGATRRLQREEMVDRFQNDPQAPPIFILSLKAGGVGLNLTRANHVFHIDRWWNPAVENQATDRAFRIGQKQNVQVHKFVCTGTLEEKINDMIESKKNLAQQTVDAGEEWLTELDTDKLRNLLILDRDGVIDEGNN